MGRSFECHDESHLLAPPSLHHRNRSMAKCYPWCELLSLIHQIESPEDVRNYSLKTRVTEISPYLDSHLTHTCKTCPESTKCLHLPGRPYLRALPFLEISHQTFAYKGQMSTWLTPTTPWMSEATMCSCLMPVTATEAYCVGNCHLSS